MAIEHNPRSREQYGAKLKRRREAGGFFVNFLPTLDGREVAEHFKGALEFEGKATVIKEYAPSPVPGILQTRPYAYEVLSCGFPRKCDEERDKLLVTHLERARILDDFHSPEVWELLDESVLRRVVGGPAVMCEQLRHIAQLGESRRIRAHVLPYSVGAHPLQEGFLSLMWFEDLPPIAYAEGVNSGRVLELPSVVRECQDLYDHVLGDALSHRKSLDLLRSVAEDYEHEAQRAHHP